jgi:hypothetical protein
MRGRAIKRRRKDKRPVYRRPHSSMYEPEWPGGQAPMWALIIRFVAWGIFGIAGVWLLIFAFVELMKRW